MATSINNLFTNLALTSPRPLNSENTGLEQESSFIPGLIDINNFDNTIIPEPWYNKLKMELDRKKSYKVRAPNIYRGKNLDKWRTITSLWEQVFRTQPWTYNRHSARVNITVSILQDNAYNIWEII